jgi:hypothetical protein
VRLHQDHFVDDPQLDTEIEEGMAAAAILVEEVRGQGAALRNWPTAEILQYSQAIVNAAILNPLSGRSPTSIADHAWILCAAILQE